MRIFWAAITTLVCVLGLGATSHAQDLGLAVTANPATYSNVGDVITVTYTITNGGNFNAFLGATNDSRVTQINCVNGFTIVPGQNICTGTYTITQADIVAGSVTNNVEFVMACGDCVFLSYFAAATTNYAPQTNSLVPPAISLFLSQRAILLATQGPDRPRIIRRTPGNGWQNGQPPATNDTAFGFTGPADAGSRLAFAASLNDMALASRAQQPRVSNALHDRMFGYVGESSPPEALMQHGATMEAIGDPGVGAFDLWVEAHRVRFGSDSGGASADGSFSVVYLGADYLVSPDLLVGALVQFDWMDQAVGSVSGQASGTGFMAGPYVSTRLADSLFFDARVAWGQSDNRVSPNGQFTDDFETDRFLANARLTGNWNPLADVRITPSLAFTYVEESHDAFIDSLGAPVPAQRVGFGEVRFGPEIARRFLAEDGSFWEPFVNLTGAWRFDASDTQAAAGASLREGFSGRVEAGVLATAVSGVNFRLAVSADGLGADYGAYGVTGWLNIPLR